MTTRPNDEDQAHDGAQSQSDRDETSTPSAEPTAAVRDGSNRQPTVAVPGKPDGEVDTRRDATP